MVTVPCARVEATSEGTPYSAEFGDIYHSAGGGLAQARHVFLAGNRLPGRWQGRPSFTVLETGFGMGLNFLATWAAWRDDPQRCRRLHFVSVEARPFQLEDLSAALERFEELRPLATALLAVWPPPLAGIHRLHFDGGNVILTLLLGDAARLLPQLVGRADAFYLDGFAPASNPEMWSPTVVRELRRLAAPGATLGTWTVAGGVRAALLDAGFEVAKAPGFAAKREMLTGHLAVPAEATRAPVERRAVVIGAGLAGSLVAERLALREWQVELIDERAERGTAGVGLLRPVVNLRDAMNAQVSRAAFLYALQHYRALQHDGYHLQWDRCGVLQLAAGDEEARRFDAIVRSQGFPDAVLRFVDADEARDLAGNPVRGAGWFFPSGARVSPASLATATLARAGSRVRRFSGRRVERLEREGHLWRALDADSRVIAESAIIILANAADARRLAPEARLALSSVRGQITYLSPPPGRKLDIVVSGTGYVAPMDDGRFAIGATYQHDDGDPKLRANDHRENLARAEAMLPGFAREAHPMLLDGWVGFRATVPDRLPIFGATAVDGVHVAGGLGSRGLLWAPLGAELLACALEGEPLPLMRDQAGAVSPRRFLS